MEERWVLSPVLPEQQRTPRRSGSRNRQDCSRSSQLLSRSPFLLFACLQWNQVPPGATRALLENRFLASRLRGDVSAAADLVLYAGIRSSVVPDRHRRIWMCGELRRRRPLVRADRLPSSRQGVRRQRSRRDGDGVLICRRRKHCPWVVQFSRRSSVDRPATHHRRHPRCDLQVSPQTRMFREYWLISEK